MVVFTKYNISDTILILKPSDSKNVPMITQVEENI